jgi:hypothetical protein
MKFKVIVHEAEEGGYWAEVPSIKGCAVLLKAKLLRNCCKIFTKRLKVVYKLN